MTQFTTYLKKMDATKTLFLGFSLIIVLSIFLGTATNFYFLFGLPLVFLVSFLAIVDFRKVFYLLLFSIPISTEVELSGGVGTDFPSEFLIIGLMLVFGLYVLRNGEKLDAAFLKHPITLLVLLHLGWVLVTMINSENFIISFKFFLAKIWYIVTFYFLAGFILKKEKDLKNIVWCFLSALLFTIVIIMVRHAIYGFSFQDINFVLNPFYRNHVAYASIMVIFFPFLWYAPSWFARWSFKWWGLVLCIFLFLMAIYFSYTRAAYVSLLLALFAYYIIKFRLIKIMIGLSLAIGLAGLIYFSYNNRYLEFAPDYNKTITHQRFDNLIEATAKGEDISTMERIYRWVAGFYMVKERSLLGFGPGNFYNFYKPYTVNSFETYVSDNPERSGIHSYYLMTAVEQGVVGLVIFLLLCCFVLIKGEQLYHQIQNPENRKMLLMTLLSFLIICAILLINDMVETDKVGSFFFINMAILVNLDLATNKKVSLPSHPK